MAQVYLSRRTALENGWYTQCYFTAKKLKKFPLTADINYKQVLCSEWDFVPLFPCRDSSGLNLCIPSCLCVFIVNQSHPLTNRLFSWNFLPPCSLNKQQKILFFDSNYLGHDVKKLSKKFMLSNIYQIPTLKSLMFLIHLKINFHKSVTLLPSIFLPVIIENG